MRRFRCYGVRAAPVSWQQRSAWVGATERFKRLCPRGDVRAMHPRIVVDWLIGRRSGASARYGSCAGRPEQDGVIADGTTPARSCSPDKAIGAKIGTES